MTTTTEILVATEALAVKLDEAWALAARLPDSVEKAQLVQILTEDVLMVAEITAKYSQTPAPRPKRGEDLLVHLETQQVEDQIAGLKLALGKLGLGPPIITLGDPA